LSFSKFEIHAVHSVDRVCRSQKYYGLNPEKDLVIFIGNFISEIILSPIIAPLWYKITNICILTSIVFYGYNSTIYVFFIFHKKQFYGVDIYIISLSMPCNSDFSSFTAFTKIMLPTNEIVACIGFHLTL